jgi:tRNA A37 threonylcarbamoyladenosine synthetase subunit TsaC/SUA5/YrdC
MHEIVRIKRLRKDGGADPEFIRPPSLQLREGADVLLPIDGIYGFAKRPSDENLPAMSSLASELIICDFGALERRAKFSKADYDFLKRVWPDEVSVLMHPQEGTEPILARMPQSPVSKEIVALAGGALYFTPLVNEKGKPRYKFAELDAAAKDKVKLLFVIDEWCKPHQLSTIIDLRDEAPRLVRVGRVSMDEISSLFYLGPSEQ